MESPPTLRRYNPNSIAHHRRNSATKMMMIFASLLGCFIMSIHTRYLHTLVSLANESSNHDTRKRDYREEVSPKIQDFVILYGTSASGYDQVQSDFSTWTQEFNFYPWTWALPDMSPEYYTKTEHFKPLMDSIIHTSSLVPVSEPINVRERIRSNFFLLKYRDGFIGQWMQHKNIVIGSETFSYILDRKNGDRFLNTFLKTLPWNDPRFSLMKAGKLSAIILHRSSPIDHIKDLWIGNTENQTESINSEFSSWMMNEFNFDVLDSYGLAYKLVDKGVSVAFVDVDEVKDDLSHFISCNILNFPCRNGHIVGLNGNSQSTATRSLSHDNIDVSSKKLGQLEDAINQYERDYRACFQGKMKIKFYSADIRAKEEFSATDKKSCPISNQVIKEKIIDIISK